MTPDKNDPKVVISGYYGFDNCGDEAVLLSMIHCLRKLQPGIRTTVLSNNPEQTSKLYGVRAINRWNPLKIALELLSGRLLISGGGSLLQDVTSAKSPVYYLAVIRIALFLRKKVMIYAQGIGPLTLEKNRKNVQKVLNRCHTITVRDSSSAELLKSIGIQRDIHVTCDPVMALDRDYLNSITTGGTLQDLGVPETPGKPLLLVAIRSWNDDSHIAPIAKLLDIQAGKGWNILLVPAHFPGDMAAIETTAATMSTQPHIINKCLTANEFLALTAKADRVFSMRLHGLICAVAMGTPVIGLSYDPKVDAFMKQAGLERFCLSFDNFDLEKTNNLMEELDNTSQNFKDELEKQRLKMQKTTLETAEKAVELIFSRS